MKRTWAFCFFAALILGMASAARAGDFAATYVKSLGALAPSGQALVTSLGRLAVDDEGNVYAGTPGVSGYVQKLAPDGRAIRLDNVPGAQGLAIDKEYVYTCGSSYGSYRCIQRWNRASGEPAPGWKHEWTDKPTPSDGVAPFVMPDSLLVDDQYLYVVDSKGDEVRRLDKATGREKPFATPLKVVQPVDLAWNRNGNLLLLMKESVAELTKEGEPVHLALIDELSGAVAIGVHPKTGNIWVAEGGSEGEVINRIREYTPDGKATGAEVGMGGRFDGKWFPTSFAFSGGTGDFAFDRDGGLWVNPGWGWRMSTLALLDHFTPEPEYKPDRTFSGLTGAFTGTSVCGMAVDENLDVYVGGPYKISWDNHLIWTSGLTENGNQEKFPTTFTWWPVCPACAHGAVAMVVTPGPTAYTLSPDRGEFAGNRITLPGAVVGVFSMGDELYLSIHGNDAIFRTSMNLTKPLEVFFKKPATPKRGPDFLIAVSPDHKIAYYSSANQIIAYTVADGKVAWEHEGGSILAAFKGLLFTTQPGKGVLVLRGSDGSHVATFGDKAADGRPPLGQIMAMAVGSKDGNDYLFVLAQSRIEVYRIVMSQENRSLPGGQE